MDNMRRMLPAPSLRMSEGGMFNSLKRAVGMGPPETIQQKFAREDAALKAKMAASAPPAPAPAPPPKAVSGYVGNSALEGRMKAAGLRNGGDLRTGLGGHVPGKGKGDKIPAKYEPGEFVVSNDMLDAAPELREQLHSLRGQVLAEKGMTPEQADAKALSGTGLRAQVGLTPKQNSFGDAASGAPAVVNPPAPPPRSFHERMAERGTAFPTQFPDKPRTAPAPAAIKPTPSPEPPLDAQAVTDRASIKRTAGTVAGMNEKAGAAIADIATLPVRGVVGAYDTAVVRPMRAAGIDAGYLSPFVNPQSNASGASMTPFMDQIRVRDGATQSVAGAPTLRNPNQTAATAKRTGVDLSGRRQLTAEQDPRIVNADPSRASLGASRDFSNELNSRPGGKMPELPSDLRQGVVHKTVDAQGRVTYSGRNVGVNSNGETQMVDGTGRDLKMLNGNNDSFAQSLGADGKPDGPKITASMASGLRGGGADVPAALAAAAARGDTDAVRGYYANKGEGFAGATAEQNRPTGPTHIALGNTGGVGLMSKEYQDARNLRMSGMPRRERRELQQQRAAAEIAAGQRASEERKDGTDRRGQDMEFEGKRMDAESASRSSLRAAEIAERDFQTKRADRAEDQEGKLFERAQTARKNFTERANTMFPGKDGKPDAEKVAEYTSFVSRSTAGIAQKLMQSKDPIKQAAGRRLANGDMSGLDATDIKTIDEQFEIDQLTKDRSGRSTAAGSSQPVGVRNGMFRDYVKLADGSEVPKSALTGAGWFDDGDPRLLNSLNKGN